MNIIIKKTISKVSIKKRVKSVYYTTFGPRTGRVSFKFDQSITRETASVNNTPAGFKNLWRMNFLKSLKNSQLLKVKSLLN